MSEVCTQAKWTSDIYGKRPRARKLYSPAKVQTTGSNPIGLVPRGNGQGLKLIIFNGRTHAEEVIRQSKLNGKRQNLTRSGSGAHRHARNMVIEANLAGAIYSQRGIESMHSPD